MTLGRWRRHTALLERQCQEVYRSSAASLLRLGDRARKDSVERCRPLAHSVKAGVQPQEIGVFVRSQAELRRARAAVEGAKLPVRMLDEQVEGAGVSIGTMHRAKGLEFRAVVVMACDDEIIPSQQRIEEVGDDADLQEVYDTERHLLYVASTRARDELLITGVDPASEFLADLK